MIIGANGSGKSTFSRDIKKILGTNVASISAQKVFVCKNTNYIPTGNKSIEQVNAFQADDKLFREDSIINKFDSDMQNLVNSFVADYYKCASSFYEAGKKEEQVTRLESKMDTAISIWNSIITHRILSKTPDSHNLIVKYDGGQDYNFSNLSDGEKAVFYYIGHVIFAKENSYIIIDEPENHLHLSVISKLWDELEKIRTDCQFIYLTHNLDFAASRINAKKLWNKKFTPPAQWDIEPLPDDTELPEALLMQLLGSRKKILFCEGTNTSLDYKLYTLLFKDYTIVPVQGHLEVINYTKSFNKINKIHGNEAIGIIDGDYHSSEQIDTWEKESIFTIPVQEVENLLCDENLLKKAKRHFFSESADMGKTKTILFERLDKEAEKQAIVYTRDRVNDFFKQNMLKNNNCTDELISELNGLVNSLNIKSWYDERLDLLKSIANDKDYDKALKHYNNKKLVDILTKDIDKEYDKKIFGLLSKNDDLVKELRKKYFSKIPVSIIFGKKFQDQL